MVARSFTYTEPKPVTLPVLNFLQKPDPTEPEKICFGDIYRKHAPSPPPDFEPDDKTQACRDRRKLEQKRRRRGSGANHYFGTPRAAALIWSPEAVERMLWLIDRDGLSRSKAAKKLTQEYPQPTGRAFSASAVAIKYRRAKGAVYAHG